MSKKTIKKIVIASVSHAMSSHATIRAIENQHHHGTIHQLDFFRTFYKEKTLDMMVMLADEKWEAKYNKSENTNRNVIIITLSM